MARSESKQKVARAAVESLRSIVVELREKEQILWRIQQQAKHIPNESDESPDRLLGAVYRKHSARLRALGVAVEDPDSDDLRSLLDSIKTVAKGFGADVGDTSPLPRQRPTIWTDDSRLYGMDGRKLVLRRGLRLNEDGSLANSPRD